jgi:hypothetical protein
LVASDTRLIDRRKRIDAAADPFAGSKTRARGDIAADPGAAGGSRRRRQILV